MVDLAIGENAPNLSVKALSVSARPQPKPAAALARRALALAGCLAIALPLDAFGRGLGGAAGSFHRPVAPALHRMVVHRPEHRATMPERPLRDVAAHQAGRFAVRHRHAPTAFGFAIGTVDGGWTYGTPVAPDGNAVADDATYDDPAGPRRAPVLFNAPACRTQDYVVPDRNGEDSSVRVLRC